MWQQQSACIKSLGLNQVQEVTKTSIFSDFLVSSRSTRRKRLSREFTLYPTLEIINVYSKGQATLERERTAQIARFKEKKAVETQIKILLTIITYSYFTEKTRPHQSESEQRRSRDLKRRKQWKREQLNCIKKSMNLMWMTTPR